MAENLGDCDLGSHNMNSLLHVPDSWDNEANMSQPGFSTPPAVCECSSLSGPCSSHIEMLRAHTLDESTALPPLSPLMPVLDVPPPRHGTYGLLASAIGASTPSNGTARDMTFAQPDFMSAKERMRSPNGSSTIMMTPRFGIVLETMRQTGFDDFEDMAVAYYTSQFEWGSVPAMLQSVSRSRRLKPMLHELSQNSKKWPRWQSRGLQESISRAAVTLCVGEMQGDECSTVGSSLQPEMAKFISTLEWLLQNQNTGDVSLFEQAQNAPDSVGGD
ncbi:unnamed protein product [Alternaria alternata]